MTSSDSVEVGVVNPKFLYQYGRELSLTRLKVHNWNTLLEQLQSSNLDIYTLFGPFDLLCKNYYVKRTYELPQLFADYNISESLFSEPTPFEVESIDRFENFYLDWQKEVDLELTVENLKYLDEIQRDWNSVPTDVRERFIKSAVIFPNPVNKNSQHEYKGVKAFVFLKLPAPHHSEFSLSACGQVSRL